MKRETIDDIAARFARHGIRPEDFARVRRYIELGMAPGCDPALVPLSDIFSECQMFGSHPAMVRGLATKIAAVLRAEAIRDDAGMPRVP